MRLMPALAEEDFASFGDAIGEIQRAVGDYFAQAQGGRFTSAAVALCWPGSKRKASPAWDRLPGVRPDSP